MKYPEAAEWLKGHAAQLAPHPARFFRDQQWPSGIKNYHGSLHSFLQAIPPSALVLDLGSGNRKLRWLDGEAVSFDIQWSSRVDVVGDAHRLPFKDACFDAIVLQQVLEHVKDPELVLREAGRAVKAGGLAWIETPFLYPVHDRNDFWRWTLQGLEMLCSKYFQKVEAGTIMGGASAVSATLRSYIAILVSRGNRYLYWFTWILVGWLTFWVKYLDELVGLHKRPIERLTWVAGGFYFKGRRLDEGIPLEHDR